MSKIYIDIIHHRSCKLKCLNYLDPILNTTVYNVSELVNPGGFECYLWIFV